MSNVLGNLYLFTNSKDTHMNPTYVPFDSSCLCNKIRFAQIIALISSLCAAKLEKPKFILLIQSPMSSSFDCVSLEAQARHINLSRQKTTSNSSPKWPSWQWEEEMILSIPHHYSQDERLIKLSHMLYFLRIKIYQTGYCYHWINSEELNNKDSQNREKQ